jgi:hypothetical protein
LRITNLPNNVDIELLKSQIKNQSTHVSAELESLYLVPEVATTRPTFTAFLRMATIGTALGARLRLASLRYYQDCQIEFMMDPCERDLEELALKWNAEKYWDMVEAQNFQMQPYMHQYHMQFPQVPSQFPQPQQEQQQTPGPSPQLYQPFSEQHKQQQQPASDDEDLKRKGTGVPTFLLSVYGVLFFSFVCLRSSFFFSFLMGFFPLSSGFG